MDYFYANRLEFHQLRTVLSRKSFTKYWIDVTKNFMPNLAVYNKWNSRRFAWKKLICKCQEFWFLELGKIYKAELGKHLWKNYIFPLGIWFFDSQNGFYLMVKGLKMPLSMHFLSLPLWAFTLYLQFPFFAQPICHPLQSK